MMTNNTGASKTTGLSQAEPEEGLGPPGFDPSRGRPTIHELEQILNDSDQPHVVAKWLSVAKDGPPEPEVFVLCWDGKETFVDWFGGKPDAGRGVTHWIPYETPPGATSDMHDGRRALRDSEGSPQGEDALAASSETTARAEGIARKPSP